MVANAYHRRSATLRDMRSLWPPAAPFKTRRARWGGSAAGPCAQRDEQAKQARKAQRGACHVCVLPAIAQRAPVGFARRRVVARVGWIGGEERAACPAERRALEPAAVHGMHHHPV